ncbi:MAG: hypothetical protein ACXW06_03815 [Halobacteriota archaeon]
MCSDEKHVKRVKIRLHELREDSDAAELVKFLARRNGVIKVEVIADLFTIYITYDESLTSLGQIIADLSTIRFTPEGSTVLNG